MARKPGTTPRFAKSQIELGAYLTPPRDRKIIQRALKMEGNPGRAKDGRYDVGEWQAFIYANANPKRVQKGPAGKETWKVTRSVSFAPTLLEEIDAHRTRLGVERSRYVGACVEHVHGIRPHPELFEASMRR